LKCDESAKPSLKAISLLVKAGLVQEGLGLEQNLLMHEGNSCFLFFAFLQQRSNDWGVWRVSWQNVLPLIDDCRHRRWLIWS